jgi:hypothetical protein
MMTSEEHWLTHLDQGDSVAYQGKFVQGASSAGRNGGASRSDKKIKACSENMKRNRRSDLGAKASIESRRKNKTFFFSEEFQTALQSRMKSKGIGPYSESQRKVMQEMGKCKGKRPMLGDKIWNSSYEASIDMNLPASTIRYRCKNKTLGWRYENE